MKTTNAITEVQCLLIDYRDCKLNRDQLDLLSTALYKLADDARTLAGSMTTGADPLHVVMHPASCEWFVEQGPYNQGGRPIVAGPFQAQADALAWVDCEANPNGVTVRGEGGV